MIAEFDEDSFGIERPRKRKPEWLRATPRHTKQVKSVDGAARRRDKQLAELKRLGLSATVGQEVFR